MFRDSFRDAEVSFDFTAVDRQEEETDSPSFPARVPKKDSLMPWASQRAPRGQGVTTVYRKELVECKVTTSDQAGRKKMRKTMKNDSFAISKRPEECSQALQEKAQTVLFEFSSSSLREMSERQVGLPGMTQWKATDGQAEVGSKVKPWPGEYEVLHLAHRQRGGGEEGEVEGPWLACATAVNASPCLSCS